MIRLLPHATNTFSHISTLSDCSSSTSSNRTSTPWRTGVMAEGDLPGRDGVVGHWARTAPCAVFHPNTLCPEPWRTRVALAEDHLPGRDGVVAHAARQLEELRLAQRKEHRYLSAAHPCPVKHVYSALQYVTS